MDAVNEAFRSFGNELAAVIIEPIPANNGLLIQRPEFLHFLRECCTKHNTLLIFDEVISGFRVGFEGAAGYYDIRPDLVTYGKIIGGGFPVGAYAGKKEIMNCVSPEGKVYQAGTLSGNPVAMTAGFAQLSRCLEKNFYTSLREKCSYFAENLNSIAPEILKVVHLESIFWLSFSPEKEIRTPDAIDTKGIEIFNRLYHRLLEKGIYLGPSGYEVGFISEAHSYSDLDYTIEAFRQIIPEILLVC
jgi:glutamate-1-semialdehyde 2,1-aminomutase